MVERISKDMGTILTVVGDSIKCIVRRTYNDEVSIVVLNLIGDYIETVSPEKGQSALDMGVEAVLYVAKQSSTIVIEYPESDRELDDMEMNDMRQYQKKVESLWDAD